MAVAQPNLPIGPTTGPLNPDFDAILNNQTQSGITFNIQDYKNKYLDGEGVQKLWKRTLEEIKLSVNSASAKIIPLDFTNGTSIEFNSSSTDEEDQAILAILAGLGTQDIMVWEGNKTYYCSTSTKTTAYWRHYTSTTIYVVSCEMTLNSDETKITKAVFKKATEKYTATTLTGTGGSLTYDNLKDAITTTDTDLTNNKIIIGNGNKTVKDSIYEIATTFNGSNNKDIPTSNLIAAYVANRIEDATNDLVAIAEGKTKAYTIYAGNQSSSLYVSGSETFKSTANSITLSNAGQILLASGTNIDVSTLKVGDVIFLVDAEYPDRWVGSTTSSGTVLYAIEGKVDLSGYQPLDADLTAIAGLTGGGLLKRNSNDTWSLDTTAYAGGTAVTLNSTSKAGSTASFYAPTAAGTANQVLISNGSNKAPTWTSQGNITAGKVGKSISFTDNDWTIKDGPSYDGSEAIVVTADDVGAVPIKHTGSPYSGHIGYSGNTPRIYTSNADGDTLSLIGVGNNLIALAVGESYFEITADSITFKDNKIVDYSMTLTTTEIDTILANS